MVSARQLQQQQAQLRQVRSGLNLRQQQQALRQGISQQQFIRREEDRIREKAQAQITQQLKQQGSNIDDILKNVNSISQFKELINQVPQELRQFVKTTESSLQQELQKRITRVETKIANREDAIQEKIQSRRDALQDNNESQAQRFEIERRVIEKERDFLKAVLPRFQQGELLPIDRVFSIATKVGIAEEEKRKLLDQELNKLSSKLEGGRQELSIIIRTQQVTSTQAIQLGLVPTQVPIGQPLVIKELQPPTELLPGGVTQIGGQIQKRIISEEDIPPGFRDVFQKITQKQKLEGDLLGDIGRIGEVDISKETRVEGVTIDLAGFPVTFPIAEPDPRLVTGIEKVIGFPRKVIEKRLFEREKEIAERGILIPTDISGEPQDILTAGKETLQFIPKFLTEEEILKQTFGGGLGEIEKIRVRQAEVDLRNLANSEADKQLPNFKKRGEDKSIELQNKVNARKISVEDANIELNEFFDKLNKEYIDSIEKVVDKKAGELTIEINKEITDAFKRNAIKRELILLTATIPTGFALGFLGGLSPVIAAGLGVFGAIQVVKTAPIVVTAVKTGDIQTLGSIGIQAGGFAIGGFIGAKIGGKLIQSRQIKNAIQRARIKSKIIARDIEVLRKLKLPPELQAEIKTLIDKGFSVRVVETKLIASNLADGKIIPDVRGRFIEIVNRDGVVVDVISIGSVVSVVKGKIYSQDIISESVGKIEGQKVQFVTRSIIGKLKGDKFVPTSQVQTFQETTLIGRQVTPTKELTLTESITKLLAEGKIKGKAVDITKIQRGFIGDNFGFRSLKEFGGEFIIKGKKVKRVSPGFDLKALELKLATGAKGKLISRTQVITGRKITSGDITFNRLIRTEKVAGLKVTQNIGDLLTSLKQFESKAFGLTISVPEIKVTTPKPRDTLKEVFGAGTDVGKFKFLKFDFKEFFKTKEGQILQQQQTQINQNLDLLTQTTAPGVVTKIVTKVKPDVKPVFVTGKIGELDLSSGFGDLGVLSNRLGGDLLTGLEEEQKQRGGILGRTATGLLSGLETKEERKRREKAGLLFPDITKSISDLGQLPKTSPLFAQTQPQLQLQLQLEKLQTNLAGFDFAPTDLTINIPELKIPIITRFPDEKKKRKLPPSKLDIGFNVFVKSKGKQIKVTKNTVIESTAQDIGSFLVDNTLSAEFSLRKSRKQPKQPKIQVPKNYWELNKNKFRQFRIKKGQPIPLKNTFIELKSRRLDTFGEIRNITAERLISQRRVKKKSIDQVSKNLNKIFGF